MHILDASLTCCACMICYLIIVHLQTIWEKHCILKDVSVLGNSFGNHDNKDAVDYSV